jgi:hypothetical protein
MARMILMTRSAFALLALILLLGAAPPTVPPRCVARGPLPDPVCTPGVVVTTDLAVVCGTPTKERRRVSDGLRRAVLEEYGIATAAGGTFEVDHLIPLELGGSNALGNLWPEAAAPPPGFHQKDEVENYLHRRVCSGVMPIEQAQREIATDWTVFLSEDPARAR